MKLKLSLLIAFAVPVVTWSAPRNVVFLLVDDLGWKDIGAYGSSFYETPNVDSLAATGLRFTDAYAACPVCSPTRASILTGTYPTRNEITDYIGAAQPTRWRRNTPLLPAPYAMQLGADETTLAEALKAKGYTTFFAGKWHLGDKGSWPTDHGFDINIAGHKGGGPYGGKKYFSPYGNPNLTDGPPGEHLPARLAEETVAFMKANKDKPFLAYLSFYSVHTPLLAREDLKKKYAEKAQNQPVETWGQEGGRKVREVQRHAVYGGMVEAMDLAVGRVLAGLKELGLEENTAVFFMSDNGGLSTSEGSPTSNLPLRGGKGWLYEGGIREPMIARVPGYTTAGTVTAAPVTSTDFYPTILDVLGLPLLPEQHQDGQSFAHILKDPSKTATRPLFWHYPHYGNQGGFPGAVLRDGDWKLVQRFENPDALELYNLKDDIGERNNLAAKDPQRVKQMTALLRQIQNDTGAKPTRPNPNFNPNKPRYK